MEPHLVEPHLVKPDLVKPYLVYIVEESMSELHPTNSKSGAPVIFLELPSIIKQFQGYLDYSGRKAKRRS